MANHYSILAWRIYGQRSLVGYSLWSHTASDMTEATEHTCVFAVELCQQIETRQWRKNGDGMQVS